MHIRLLTELVQTIQDLIRSHAQVALADLRTHAAVRLGDRLSQLPDAVRGRSAATESRPPWPKS